MLDILFLNLHMKILNFSQYRLICENFVIFIICLLLFQLSKIDFFYLFTYHVVDLSSS